MGDTTVALPPAAWSADAGIVGQYLSSRGLDYLLVDRLNNQHAHVRFLGPFKGNAVVWDCDFLTLAAAQEAGLAFHPDSAALRNVIEVGDSSPRGRSLRVALDLSRIDRPAIEKMIIMIRNYKRLSVGRHEFGPALNREP